jgi:hypothetical protein
MTNEFTFSNLMAYAFFLGVWAAVIVLWMGWVP